VGEHKKKEGGAEPLFYWASMENNGGGVEKISIEGKRWGAAGSSVCVAKRTLNSRSARHNQLYEHHEGGQRKNRTAPQRRDRKKSFQ